MQDANRFCVYIHKRKDTNQIFYIGQGLLTRARCATRKIKAWNDTVKEAGGFTFEIYKDKLTKPEALSLELELIAKYRDIVVNNPHSSSITRELDFKEFDDKFYIDESCPSGLRYKVDVFTGVKYAVKVHRQGDQAGIVDKLQGSWVLSHDRRSIRVHRIIYLLKNGSIDSSKVIDHLDGNSFNNRLDNLRQVDQKTNRRNLKKDKRNTTGVTGVSYSAPSNSYRSAVSSDTKRYTANFAIGKYGKEEAFRLACEWKDNKLKELNEQGAGYTERHGS